MVYMHFPNHLTEEEEMLQRKFAKLKKKKRLLQALKQSQKPEPPPQNDNPKKRSSEEALNATEQAKKLLKAGAIKVASDKKDSREFKRTKRQKDQDKAAVGFTPFSASLGPDEDEGRPSPEDKGSGGPKPKVRGLYESFVSSRDREESSGHSPDRDRERDRSDDRERDRERHRDRERDRDRDRDRGRDRRESMRDRGRDLPTKGNTIYIFGLGITEDLVQKAFSNLGNIVNVSMEADKNCCFVTFEKMESADEAIAQMNGSMMAGVQLKVSMARRQPTFENNADSSSSSWSSIAASHSQKGGHKDKRSLVTYGVDDDIF